LLSGDVGPSLAGGQQGWGRFFVQAGVTCEQRWQESLCVVAVTSGVGSPGHLGTRLLRGEGWALRGLRTQRGGGRGNPELRCPSAQRALTGVLPGSGSRSVPWPLRGRPRAGSPSPARPPPCPCFIYLCF